MGMAQRKCMHMGREKTYIIAEAGVNHNGSLTLAKQLVDAAKEAGADAVKFQSFKADKIVSKEVRKAAYQVSNTGNQDSQYDMLKQLELTEQMHHELYDYCREVDIDFLSTPFDLESLHFLMQHYSLPYIKVPSGELTNSLLLHHITQYKKQVIVSTGMASLGDVEDALSVLAHGWVTQSVPSSLEECKKVYYTAEANKPYKNM